MEIDDWIIDGQGKETKAKLTEEGLTHLSIFDQQLSIETHGDTMVPLEVVAEVLRRAGLCENERRRLQKMHAQAMKVDIAVSYTYKRKDSAAPVEASQSHVPPWIDF